MTFSIFSNKIKASVNMIFIDLTEQVCRLKFKLACTDARALWIKTKGFMTKELFFKKIGSTKSKSVG